MGTLFDTPTFEWMDAHEQTSTTFYYSLQDLPVGALGDVVLATQPDGSLADAAHAIALDLF